MHSRWPSETSAEYHGRSRIIAIVLTICSNIAVQQLNRGTHFSSCTTILATELSSWRT